MEEIKPCPFCGKKDFTIKQEPYGGSNGEGCYYIDCHGCGVLFNDCDIKRFNDRANPEERE